MSDQAATQAFTCLDFRRAKLADPRRLSIEAEEHLIGCPACQTFARRVNEGERRLARALEVPVPDGLSERILLSVRNPGVGRRAYRLWALAATVVMTIGMGYTQWIRAPHDYAEEALAHVVHEPEVMRVSTAVPDAQLADVLQQFGANLREPIGVLRVVKVCPTTDGHGWHIVFDSPQGRATLLLFPGVDKRDRVLHAVLRGMDAIAAPGGTGYYAVVADSSENMMAITADLQRKIDWNPRPAAAAPLRS